MIAPHVPGDLPVMLEAEVAFYLRLRLGTDRAWTFFLTSERKTGIDEPWLTPVFRAGRRWYYSQEEVFAFADRFAAEHPEAKPGVKPVIQLAKDVAPTSTKTRTRYRPAMLYTPTPRTPATVH